MQSLVDIYAIISRHLWKPFFKFFQFCYWNWKGSNLQAILYPWDSTSLSYLHFLLRRMWFIMIIRNKFSFMTQPVSCVFVQFRSSNPPKRTFKKADSKIKCPWKKLSFFPLLGMNIFKSLCTYFDCLDILPKLFSSKTFCIVLQYFGFEICAQVALAILLTQFRYLKVLHKIKSFNICFKDNQ